MTASTRTGWQSTGMIINVNTGNGEVSTVFMQPSDSVEGLIVKIGESLGYVDFSTFHIFLANQLLLRGTTLSSYKIKPDSILTLRFQAPTKEEHNFNTNFNFCPILAVLLRNAYNEKHLQP